jgi:NhaP-type Na+/H+ or K+/H+ antiporter
MNVLPLAALALGIVLLGLVSRRIERVFLTPPLVFVAFGFLLGADVLGIAAFEIHAPFIHRLAEWTLVLVLVTDAARIDLRSIQREHDLPLRLLLIGLPLTITAGAVLGHWLFPALGFAGAALLASILAPTDAALGDAVLHDTRVPVRVRQSLNVESGLNDGLAVPAVLFFTVLAGASHDPARDWVLFILTQLALGPLIGAAVGALGGIAVERAVAAGWMSGAFQRLAGPALAFLAWSAALLAGGNGFIAAFVAGLAMGHFARNACGVLHAFGEAEGQLLALITFVLFGAAMVPFTLAHATPAIWLYALASLTIVRMIPVALAEAVEEHRHRADVEPVGTQPHQVVQDASDLVEHDADVLRANRRRDSQQALDREHVAVLVAHHRNVVEPIHVADRLVERFALGELLGGPMQ